MSETRISSLHDDVAHPLSGGLEYDPDKGYPHKFVTPGEKGENTIIHRIRQFGIEEQQLVDLGLEDLRDISEEQYERLMVEVLRKQYDTIFASVYGRWSEMDLEAQRGLIERVSKMYRQWGMKLDAVGSSSPRLIMSLEGADFIRSVEDVDLIVSSGIKSVMPQYNKENALAGSDGLTVLGKEVVATLFKRGLNVDLSHSIPAVRAGIFQISRDLGTTNLVSYSHGASATDIARDSYFSSAAEKRGLQPEEISEIVKGGGIIGLGVSRPFFQSLDHMAERVDSICQQDNGPSSLGLGTDFGGVAPMLLLDGVSNAGDLVKIGEVLAQRFGYDEAKVQDILRNNVRNWSEKLK